MNIVELLKLRGLDTKKSTKMIRHTDHGDYLISEMTKKELEIYQRCQDKGAFKGLDYVVSFRGLERTKAKFIGVYKVTDEKPLTPRFCPKNYRFRKIFEGGGSFYELEKVSGFEDLEGRVIIEWGQGMQWAQWLSNEKEVFEIRPPGAAQPFPDYLDLILEFDRMRKMVDNPDSWREWHTMLSVVAGVYLIVDTKTGKPYVGLALGEDGIIGRWAQYAKNGHGDNEGLKKLLCNHGSTYANNFSFSILETLPKNWTDQKMREREKVWKDKLRSREFGLNLN